MGKVWEKFSPNEPEVIPIRDSHYRVLDRLKDDPAAQTKIWRKAIAQGLAAGPCLASPS
jgi:hypothetical protein